MGILSTIKRWFSMIFKRQAENDFNVESIVSPEMEKAIDQCAKIYHGQPEWLDDDEGIKTINFAKALCSETARLVTLGIGIHLEGSARATWLQEQIDLVYSKLGGVWLCIRYGVFKAERHKPGRIHPGGCAAC
jgi:hypothetical protein